MNKWVGRGPVASTSVVSKLNLNKTCISTSEVEEPNVSFIDSSEHSSENDVDNAVEEF